MEKEKIKECISWACESMRRHIQENCVNKEICNYMFVAIRLNKENESSHFMDFINLIKKDKLELINGSDLCEQISEEQSSLTWVDFTPYRVEKGTLFVMCKLVPFGNCENEIGFHVSIDGFRHYPIFGQKYDLNYFWQVSDKDYNIREKIWCKRSQKILRKYKIQRWFAERIYKYFGKKLKILDLDKEMKNINVFS
ncbi:MAG: hypothetical protein VZQ98_10895 [Bacteroidales bacterium]|nr:hypothetical protein [Bacteroidales bacterium]